MGNGLSGISSVAYQGTNAATPPNITTHHNRPTPNFYQNFQIGDFWVYIPLPPGNNNELWVLMGVAANIANWVLIGGGTGVLLGLTGNSGGEVFPLLGNINVVGDTTTINIVGNPGTHTLTASTSGAVATSYITNPPTGTAVPAAGVLTFAGTGGAVISASGSTVTIDAGAGDAADSFPTDSGTATPLAGVLEIKGLAGGNISTSAPGPSNIVDIAVSGTTNHALQVGNSTGSLTSLSVATNGQLPIGSTGANPVIATLTPGSGISITNGAGSIQISATGGTAPTYSNIGLTINTGASTITVNSASGAAFSATNPGYITFPSLVTVGTFVTIAVTSNVSMNWSDMTNNTMGIVSGTAWANILPLYLYAVLNSTENACTFAWSRVPNHAVSSPNSSGGLGSPASATANSNANNAFFLFQSVVLNNYAQTPVVVLGSATATADATPAWTFSALITGTTGIGCFCEDIQFNMPLGQNGAYAGSIFNGYPGGTPPLSSGQGMLYALKRNGTLFLDADMSNIGTVGSGSGSDVLVLMSPYYLQTRGGSCFTAGSGSSTLTGAYKAVPLYGGSTYGYCGITFTHTEPTIMLTNQWDTLSGSGMQGSLNMAVLGN